MWIAGTSRERKEVEDWPTFKILLACTEERSLNKYMDTSEEELLKQPGKKTC